ncbi:MAG: IPT/TIG domain-containing protein [Acidobacteriia bacterium]|nr:IPT/TIG domain-containing protein [Terriglobia bacterium]
MRAMRKGFFIVLMVAAGLALGTESVSAQAVLNLPRILLQNGQFTGVAISNPTDRTATIQLQLYTASGAPINFAGKSSSFKLAPGAQMAQFADQLFPLPTNFDGWAQITSSSAVNLRGFYLIGDNAVTFLDGTNGAQAYRQQILPFIANGGDVDTEVTIVNPTAQVAFASIQPMNFDGTAASSGSSGLTLQPFSLLRRSTREMLGSSNTPDVSYFTITSNVGLLAVELVQGHNVPSLACLNGVDVNAAGSSVFFPHAVVGGEFFSQIGIINLLNIAQTASISLYRDDGVLMNTGSIPNPVQVTLAPNASIRTSLATLFGLDASSPDVIGGWVSIHSNFGPISGFMTYGSNFHPELAAVSPQVRPLNQMVFSHLAPASTGYYTGIALLNSNSSSANVQLTVIDGSGVTTAVRQLTLGPNQKIAQLIPELIPAAQNQVGGSLVVSSDQPLYGLELIGSTSLTVMANVPPDDTSNSFFTPAEVGKFIIAGTLTQPDGSPLAGAILSLSGSIAGIQATSDDQGNYVFLNVPTGNYAIEPSLKNFSFSPAAQSVLISTTSIGDVNFQGAHLPNLAITSISPPNGPVGSPVTLHGTGFSTLAGNNLVQFYGTLSPTTVLNNPPPTDSSITVLVPASARTGPVVVAEGGVVSNSVQFSVTEANSTAVTLSGAVPSSVAISGLGNLALVGHSESGTVSLVSLTPSPAFVQDVPFAVGVKSQITAVATDDDGTGGGTTRDHGAGFFNIEEVSFKALQRKVARFGAKVDRPPSATPGPQVITAADVNFVDLPNGSNPVALAFEPFGRFAMTANLGTDSVSFIEFPQKAVPALRGQLNLPTGSKPVSVSVAANGTRALVANSGNNSVSVIEFAPTSNGFLAGGLQPVVTRNFLVNSSPNGVAINLNGTRGVTANADNTASILNLTGPADSSAITTVVLPVFTPGTPSAVSVAMAPNGSYAILTSRDAQGNAYLNVLTLEGTPEVSYVQLLPKGSGTSAVAIGPNSSSILVANPLASNVSVFNPTSGNISLETLSLSRAHATESVTLFGTGFSSDASKNVVRFLSSNQASIPAPVLSMPSPNEITVEVPVGAVSGPVTVNVANTSSNEQFFVVLPNVAQNSVPVLQSVFPNTISSSRNNTLTLVGSGFNANSTVEIDLGGGAGRQSLNDTFPDATLSLVSSTVLQLFIPQGDAAFASGSFSIDVLNPPPGGGRSSSLTVTVTGSSGHGLLTNP